MSWQLLTLLSVLSLSVSVILQRVLMYKDKTNPFAYVIVFQGLVGALLMTFALLHGFSLQGLEAVLLPAALSVILFGIGHIVYAKTLQRLEASSFSVVFASQAVWTMVLGIILLGEQLTFMQIIGSLLVGVSIVVLVPSIRRLFKEKGVGLGLLTAVFFGVAIFLWSYVGRFTDPLSWAAISFLTTALLVLIIRPKAVQHMRPLLTPRIFLRMVSLAAVYGVGSLAMLLAYMEGSFAVVSPLRQTSIIITVLLALILLPAERSSIGKKILAAAVSLAGVVLIIL